MDSPELHIDSQRPGSGPSCLWRAALEAGPTQPLPLVQQGALHPKGQPQAPSAEGRDRIHIVDLPRSRVWAAAAYPG